ncbi:MAG: pilus assembly FimT family protein [Bdellovibrionales bacterium]
MVKEKGFSLIEVLIVLGILGTLTIFAATRPKNPQKEYNRFFRRFSLMSKKIRNQALLENATYRVVFLLNDDEEPKIWVEKSNKKVLLGDEKETREKFKEILDNVQKKKTSKNAKAKSDPDGFKKASRFNFQKLKKPRSLRIKQIEVSGIDYPIEDGLVFYHYFPHGLVEETAIQFTNTAGTYKSTTVSDSISGEVFKISGHKSLKRLQER